MTSRPAVPPSVALSLLSLCELFADLDTSSLADLASELEVVRLRGGETLMQQGERAECMYSVVSGRLHVFNQAGDCESSGFLGEVGRGECVGETELIDGGLRIATVRAVRDTELVRVSRAGFEGLVRQYPELMTRIAHGLVSRMRRLVTLDKPATTVRTIAVMGAGGDLSLPGFTAGLCKALGAFGEVLHLSRDRFEKLYTNGGGFDQDSGIATWLGELEGAYRFNVYEADEYASPWTMHCVRQADCILAVGRAWSSPELSAVEKAVFGERDSKRIAPIELVLLHEETGQVFKGTAVWLAGREVIRHHHIRLRVQGDMERLARILAGRANGLALGGGGARGFAHIGVIRAIEEAGIPIDMICGVSMGAVIAGQYALGCGWESMVRMNKTEIGASLGADLTLPLISLSSGRRFRRALKTFFAKTDIEDLWLNYFCVSCNLTTSELMIHRRGSLWTSVNASNAIPGILPPVLKDGHVLVDGGILNNQPGDILQQMCGGSVIVSNVSPRREMAVDGSYLEMPSPWRVLWSRLNPFGKAIGVPNISAMMMRTLLVASDRKSREVESAADYYLRPPIDRFRLNDYSKIEEIVDVGYQYAKKEIAGWQARGCSMAAAP